MIIYEFWLPWLQRNILDLPQLKLENVNGRNDGQINGLNASLRHLVVC